MVHIKFKRRTDNHTYWNERITQMEIKFVNDISQLLVYMPQMRAKKKMMLFTKMSRRLQIQ
jgi:hypothetical protein